MNGKPVAKMIEKLLPDFAWQTAFEVLTMMETHILNEAEKTGEPEHDVSQNSVSVGLKALVERGVVERKMVRIKQAIERRGKKEVFHYRRIALHTEDIPAEITPAPYQSQAIQAP